jgi:hypothetical protein
MLPAIFMKPQLRHLIYLIGLVTAVGSYLFWGSMHFTFAILLLVGFITALLSFLAIIKKDKPKIVVYSLLIAVSFFVSKLGLKGWLIGRSFDFTLVKHEKLFAEVNNILISKSGNVAFPATYDGEENTFSVYETALLKKFLKETDVLFIRKDATKIFYPTYGIMDNDGGLFYFYSNYSPINHFGHVKGKWYYD